MSSTFNDSTLFKNHNTIGISYSWQTFGKCDKIKGIENIDKIIDIDQKKRIITATTEHEGHALDAIEILGLKYNLSIVK